MQEKDAMLSEADLALLDALQVNPRASWTLIGRALEVDPVTAARRWARLSQDGTAWVSVSIGPRETALHMAFIEVQCERGASRGVAAALARRHNVVTVQYMAGAHDLFVIVMAAGFMEMSDLLLVDVPALEGVARTRSHLVTRHFEATGRWRLRVLGQNQVRQLCEAAYPTPSAKGARPFGVADRALFRELSTDGRRTHAEIAEMIGLSARTVQRRITALMSSGEITFRCDVARNLTGWPSAAVLWLNVPDDRLDEAGRVLGRRPEVRTCAALADERNLLLSVGLRSVSDLHGLLVEILHDVPYARILDRNIVLRQEKLCGRILDATGSSVEAVHMDPWADGS
jgi:DNA-binding Lrp family transcriptional regulator